MLLGRNARGARRQRVPRRRSIARCAAAPPWIDLEVERRLHARCSSRRSREGLLRSAHDVAEGGLAVALAECCIIGEPAPARRARSSSRAASAPTRCSSARASRACSCRVRRRHLDAPARARAPRGRAARGARRGARPASRDRRSRRRRRRRRCASAGAAALDAALAGVDRGVIRGSSSMATRRTGFREECGVVGVFGHPGGGEPRLPRPLRAPAPRAGGGGHRLVERRGADRRIAGMGLVADVFDRGHPPHASRARPAIGHVRYSTAGVARSSRTRSRSSSSTAQGGARRRAQRQPGERRRAARRARGARLDLPVDRRHRGDRPPDRRVARRRRSSDRVVDALAPGARRLLAGVPAPRTS